MRRTHDREFHPEAEYPGIRTTLPDGTVREMVTFYACPNRNPRSFSRVTDHAPLRKGLIRLAGLLSALSAVANDIVYEAGQNPPPPADPELRRRGEGYNAELAVAAATGVEFAADGLLAQLRKLGYHPGTRGRQWRTSRLLRKIARQEERLEKAAGLVEDEPTEEEFVEAHSPPFANAPHVVEGSQQ